MKSLVFASRNEKELLRDPLTFIFGLGMPIFLLGLVKVLNSAIPVDECPAIFEMSNFAPCSIVFSYSFITLFFSILIAKDKNSSFLTRLFMSPMHSWDFIIGYSIPLLPMAVMQGVITYIFAMLLGLPVGIEVFISMLLLIPVALLFVAFGLLVGTLFSDKQVGIFGTIIIQLAALSSGMWFDLRMVGGAIEIIADCLPFVHAANIAQAPFKGDYSTLPLDFAVLLGYTLVVYALASFAFSKRMKKA